MFLTRIQSVDYFEKFNAWKGHLLLININSQKKFENLYMNANATNINCRPVNR